VIRIYFALYLIKTYKITVLYIQFEMRTDMLSAMKCQLFPNWCCSYL